MVIKHLFRSLGVTALFLLFMPLVARAQVPTQGTLPGASNAADYQPPTGNPQNNVGSVSQGQTDQSNLQKPETVDQTALPLVSDLRVSGVSSQPNTNTTKTEVSNETSQKNTWAAILLGAAAVAAVVLVVSSVSNRKTKKVGPTNSVNQAGQSESATTIPEQPAASDSQSSTAAKTTPTVSKKTTKRKKGKNRKTKRKR
jgi:hypothetical protein